VCSPVQIIRLQVVGLIIRVGAFVHSSTQMVLTTLSLTVTPSGSNQNPHLLLTVSNRNKTGMVALPNSLWKFNKPHQRLVLTGT
jgi:hypothetical protein